MQFNQVWPHLPGILPCFSFLLQTIHLALHYCRTHLMGSKEGLFCVCLFMHVSACLCLYPQPGLSVYDTFGASSTVPKKDQNGSLFTTGCVWEWVSEGSGTADLLTCVFVLLIPLFWECCGGQEVRIMERAEECSVFVLQCLSNHHTAAETRRTLTSSNTSLTRSHSPSNTLA